MSCMCGDCCCPSCGPAQGNTQCPLCGAWASEGCEHIGEDGNPNPQYQKQFEERYEAERKAEEEFAKQELEWNRRQGKGM